MIELTHLSLFSGIGGIDLAAEWAGFKTVAFVERDKFCQKVLAKNFPGVPIHDDIKEFGAKDVAHASVQSNGKASQAACPIGSERDTRNDAVWRGRKPTIHLLSGGFPCQPFSVAGKRKGVSDERFLWDEMLRVIREVQPLWVLGENVRGLLSIDGGRTFGTIIHELAEVGYRVGWGVYGACHVAAPHRRERVFIVASSGGRREGEIISNKEAFAKTRGRYRNALASLGAGEDVANAENSHWRTNGWCEARRISWEPGRSSCKARPNCDGWATEPNVGRVAHGVPNRVDRLRALGNAVVPQQVFPILNAIAEQIREAA